jgi:hypothetical protein
VDLPTGAGTVTGLAFVLAILALCGWPALLLDLEQWPVGVGATRDTMALDASPASKLFVVDEDHDEVEIGVITAELIWEEFGRLWLKITSEQGCGYVCIKQGVDEVDRVQMRGAVRVVVMERAMVRGRGPGLSGGLMNA